ncbi:MAG: DUF6884 domain-containing protein [Rhodospirillaceae bacterium]
MLDFSGAVVLVACTKTKRTYETVAREMFVSPWFLGVRGIVEKSGARWYVLSALHGLLQPETVIAPYTATLDGAVVRVRRVWAEGVFEALMTAEPGLSRVVIFAGARYREFLVPKLRERGIAVEIPMERLPRGRQLAWLSEHA